jgi:hypothetical protein
MSIGCKWNWHKTGHQVWYDKSTFETVKTTYPLYFYEDFVGAAGGSVFAGTDIWSLVDVATATEAIVDDSSNGQFLLHFTAGGGAEDAVLYHGNNRNFDIGNGLIFETKVDIAALPGTGVCAVVGLAGDHNLDKDTVAESAWFRWDASLTTTCETDDTVNETALVSTGKTAVAGTYNIYRIDFTTLSDVKFFVDGVRVATGTTFNMSNAASLKMQPYFSLDKGASAELGDINIDYVKIWSNRT